MSQPPAERLPIDDVQPSPPVKRLVANSHASVADENLMRDVQQGSSHALQELMQRYTQGLATFLTRMLGNREDAEDLLQESLMALWNHRDSYAYPRPFRPWLFTIAANRARDLLRNKGWQKSQTNRTTMPDQTPQPPTNQSNPLEQLVKQEQHDRVLNATACLPQQQRAVVTMRVWNQMSYAEIANILKTSESSVRSHMFHALKNLRTTLNVGDHHE